MKPPGRPSPELSAALRRAGWARRVIGLGSGRLAAVGLSVLVPLAACTDRDRDGQPERVAESFVDRMSRVHGDTVAARRAYELLALQAQTNLSERAARASGLMGRKVAPEEMLAPSSFTLAFKPRKYTATVSADQAVVVVTGESPRSQHAEFHLVRESGAWRVALDLPPLPSIRQRDEH